MAPVTRSTFAPLLDRSLRKVWFDTGKERPLEYEMIFNVESMDWNPVRDQQVAGIGSQPEKPEGSNFQLDRHLIGGDKEYLAIPYGLAIEFTWESWRDEQYGVAREMVAEMARAVRQRQEVSAWSVFNNGFDAAFDGFTTGESLFGPHVTLDGATIRNRPAADVGLSDTAIQNSIFRFETMLTERGQPRLLTPTMAIVTPQDKMTAREVLGSTGKPFVADNEQNALLGDDLGWMVSHYLTNQTNWFLTTSKEGHDLNFLWRDRPIFDSFDDKWTKNAVFTSYQRFATGFGSWRGVDGSTG